MFCRLVGKGTEIFRNFGQQKGKISPIGGSRTAVRTGRIGRHHRPYGRVPASGRHPAARRTAGTDRLRPRHPRRPDGALDIRCRRIRRSSALAPRSPPRSPRRPRTGAPQRCLQRPVAGGEGFALLGTGRLAYLAESRLTRPPAARLARRGFAGGRHDAPGHGQEAAPGRSVPRRPDLGQEHRLAGLRRAQQARLHLQPGRRDLPEQQPQSRLHAHRHELEAGPRLRQAGFAGREADRHEAGILRRIGLLPDGHDHLQPRYEEGEDQGCGHAAGRRMARGRQREEDARQYDQHPARQIHHVRRDRPPALLPGDDQGEGHSGQEGRHGSGLSGHGGCADLLSGHSRGLLPGQLGSEVGTSDAHLRRGVLQGILPARPGLLLHDGRIRRPRGPGRHLHAGVVGGLGGLALHQAIQVQRQLQHAVFEREDRRKGRTRLHQAEQLPRAVDPLAGCQGQSGLDLLGLGELRDERLQQVFGHEPQRHSGHPDQLLDLLLEELDGHAVLAVGQHGHLAELPEPVHLGDAADGGLQRFALLPVQAQGEDGQGPLVREDLDAVHGQDDQLGDDHRIEGLHEGDARKHEERHRALDPGLGVVQPLQLHQRHAVGQLYGEVVLQEGGVRVEPRDEQDRHAADELRLLPAVQLQFQRLDLDDDLRHVRLHEEAPRPQDPGHPPHADPLDRLLLRAGFQRPEIRLLPDAADRLHGTLHDLLALCGERLRRAVVGAFDVDELLAVAEPRNEGPLEARHLGREEDQAHRRAARQRIVQLPGRLDAAVDHLAVVPHDALQQLRHQPLGDARPLPRNAAGRTLRQTLLPGAYHLDGLVVRLHVQVARGQEHSGGERHHVDPSGIPEPLL